ncbi:archease [Methanococcus voltae]|uniref:Archease domain-containing protein n=1 Tax=Methanococcus voltae (strain ATCC BAA-1334 / A3) TaxID=456320 RepID=D7DTH8_METV3|nr:archease [Methanococcus voltae]MCS3901290.1 SHS2 domain-containing protein [Methanococcus voltae]
MNEYEYFETMADIGITSYGETIEKAFENAGKGLFNIMVDIDKIDNDNDNALGKFQIASDDLLSLLYDYLTELLILHDSEFLLLSNFKINIESVTEEIKSNNDEEVKEYYTLDCYYFGEEYDTKKHDAKEEVKAITYHKMNISDNKGEFKINFIVDL